MKEKQGFHSYYDANYGTLANHDRSKNGVNEAFSISAPPSYKFYPHFHPYVAELVERLVKKSVPGLQAADTEYCPSLGNGFSTVGNNDGTLEVLPDSTLVAINDENKKPVGSDVPLPKGTRIFIPDGTWVELENGHILSIPGAMTTTQPLVMIFYYATLRIHVVANQDTFKLFSQLQVRLPDGDLVTLPKGTELLFLGCKPQPTLYGEMFSSPDKELVASWKFDVERTNVAIDSSGNKNHAVLFEGASWTTQGRIDGAVSFDGGKNFAVIVPASETLNQIGNNDSDFSVAFWIYLRQGATGEYRSIMHKGIDNNERTFALWMNPNKNTIHYRISTDTDSNEGSDSYRELSLNTWTHICYVKTKGRIKFYINGILDSYVMLRGKSVGNKSQLFMGSDPPAPWRENFPGWPGIDGSLDDVHIYSGPLSEKEIVFEKEIGALARGFAPARYKAGYLVERPYPIKDLDFTLSGAYSVYNWELFYHVPITLAIHLSKNQRFEEAQKWFHYIFDPTSSSGGGDDDADLPAPERFWKVKTFQYTDVKLIEEILSNLASGADDNLKDETLNSIEAWRNAPFRPHVVARYRQTAYMFKAVMAYLDNLIDWGDSLFRQDTGESINEATQFYVLAANILGPRPQAVPKKERSVRPMTYASLRENSNNTHSLLRDLETDIPFDLTPLPHNSNNNNIEATDRGNGSTTLRTLFDTALYFCVPRNDKLLSYWDTVADRLFKIHNSLNIQGIFRQLPLFAPPIDPALLAKAAAAGLDVGAIVSGINQPLPLVRFQLLVQKAAEICQEVKSLGNNLLSAIEKEDNEALALLRAKHERVILGLAETVKYGQLQEAIKAREGLEKSIHNAIQRYTYYERLLGKQQSEIKIPELDGLDTAELEKMKLKVDEPVVNTRPIAVDIARGGPGLVRKILSSGAAGIVGAAVGAAGIVGASDITGGKKISSHEAQELSFLEAAQLLQDAAALTDILGSFAGLTPNGYIYAAPLGVGAAAQFGGSNLSSNLSAISSAARAIAGRLSYEANRAAKIGSYARREQEWAFQSNLAAGEITQIFKQLRAAQIREAIADREWKNHQQQIRFAEEIELFLTDEKIGKKTNQAFYAWMKREVKGLYAQCFQFAFDVAKKAERALQHELGNQELSFIQFTYLAGKEGLLAGEKLYLDIKRMEMAYHELNQREYELTKHVSLLQVDPLALIQLRATGRCTVRLPESLFDMDCPGHYFRRIKTVALSIPCVVGPYASVNCTLTLLKSSIRKTPLLRNNAYPRDAAAEDNDDRFSDHFGSMQSIVSSSAQNDSGLFETNLRDERYLPFENSGVISEWQLQLPADPSKNDLPQFDYETISDVILHIRYTAREGGKPLRDKAIEHIKQLVKDAQAIGSVRLFSMRHEFPTEWAKFLNQTPVANQRFELKISLRAEHYPFWSQGHLKKVARVDILARSKEKPVPNSVDISHNPDKGDTTADTLFKVPSLGGLLVGKLERIGLPAKPDGELKLFVDTNRMSDFWIAVTWNE